MSNVAVVYGANRISGSALVKFMLHRDDWSKIICVSRRPIQLDTDDKRIQFVSIDMISRSAEDIANRLNDTGAQTAQYAYFYAYIEMETKEELIKVNKMLLDKALDATALSASNLKTFLLQTSLEMMR